MLSAQNLSCRRGGRVLFRDVGLSVAAGAFLLVSGANGSGKSSLLRILAGLLEPVSGALLWYNENIAADCAAHRARLHYVGHLDALKLDLTTSEILAYWQALRGTAQKNAKDVLQTFGLEELGDRPVRRLSAGQKRRLSLTRLVLDDAPLWLLDEPTTALDRNGYRLLWEQITRHRARGGMVIAAMHEEPEICDAQRLTMGA